MCQTSSRCPGRAAALHDSAHPGVANQCRAPGPRGTPGALGATRECGKVGGERPSHSWGDRVLHPSGVRTPPPHAPSSHAAPHPRRDSPGGPAGCPAPCTRSPRAATHRAAPRARRRPPPSGSQPPWCSAEPAAAEPGTPARMAPAGSRLPAASCAVEGRGGAGGREGPAPPAPLGPPPTPSLSRSQMCLPQMCAPLPSAKTHRGGSEGTTTSGSCGQVRRCCSPASSPLDVAPRPRHPDDGGVGTGQVRVPRRAGGSAPLQHRGQRRPPRDRPFPPAPRRHVPPGSSRSAAGSPCCSREPSSPARIPAAVSAAPLPPAAPGAPRPQGGRERGSGRDGAGSGTVRTKGVLGELPGPQSTVKIRSWCTHLQTRNAQ